MGDIDFMLKNLCFLLNKVKQKWARFGDARTLWSGAWCETILRHSDWFKSASHKTAGEQLAHGYCSDFDKPCLYHPIIHPPTWSRFVQSDRLNCLGHSWIFIKGKVQHLVFAMYMCVHIIKLSCESLLTIGAHVNDRIKTIQQVYIFKDICLKQEVKANIHVPFHTHRWYRSHTACRPPSFSGVRRSWRPSHHRWCWHSSAHPHLLLTHLQRSGGGDTTISHLK